MKKPSKGLGRGLDVLLSGNVKGQGDVLSEVEIDALKPGKYQPRSRMDEATLRELAASIKAQGVMQPILARSLEDGGYEIIAGERRWRAARLAGLDSVPVLVRKVADQAVLAMALIENIQRENLNPLEEAVGIQRLIDEFKMTHIAAADAVGRSRSAVSNLLRLLKLPRTVQDMLMEGRIDMGHARALLALNGAQQVAASNKIAAEGLSVREAEKLVQDMLNPVSRNAKVKVSRDILQLQEQISQQLGTDIQIRAGKKGAGKVVIHYTSHDHLAELIARWKK
ncbi:ParB/RepB/Spo0J family partition protein [Candidatus Nitrotoga fabula]|uniref:Chromosome-partitioning protein ParB n=1 Tax=Candidatus Nitrotoga fabula TaxID=2182327 RepID=A0A916BBB4_9PROT|nr:ParB/RepB/Spo0J family partition protein [Candidatus Nitrotoga fabula]CAE6693057.1 putative chromosome-partitioning protein ParB [Candidatus Nitrotoga fabula]